MNWSAPMIVILLVPTSTWAGNSVFLGKSFENTFLSKTECQPHQLCMDSVYMWTLRVDKVLVGPRLGHEIRAIAYQHTDVASEYLRTLELFILEPILDPALRSTYGVNYKVISFSPREEHDQYCLSQPPRAVGLAVPETHVTIDDDKWYCFPRSDVRK
jgi:hypothetical protein